MTDIKKVMGIFIPPVYSSNHQGMQNALFDGNSTVIGIMDSKIEAEKLAEMINSYDTLTNQVSELRAALERIIKMGYDTHKTTRSRIQSQAKMALDKCDKALKDGEL